jgi:hypothetical protein
MSNYVSPSVYAMRKRLYYNPRSHLADAIAAMERVARRQKARQVAELLDKALSPEIQTPVDPETET